MNAAAMEMIERSGGRSRHDVKLPPVAESFLPRAFQVLSARRQRTTDAMEILWPAPYAGTMPKGDAHDDFNRLCRIELRRLRVLIALNAMQHPGI